MRIDARQMPWDPGANPEMSFGIGDGRLPRYIFGVDLHPGALLRIVATGNVTVPYGDIPAHPSGLWTADQPSAREPGGSGPGGSIPVFPVAGVDGDAPRAASGNSGPSGQSGQIANGRTGVHGTRFPSYYIETKHYPVRVNELIGIFVDADGGAVGAPFPVGTGITLRVPDGAVAIGLGLNSESFAINHGGFTALINSILPKVTVEPR